MYMTDYSKVSDYEINWRVAEELGLSVDHNATVTRPQIYCGHDEDGCKHQWCFRDYCNNPADAWPIIVKNEICIEFENDEVDGVRQVWAEASNGHFTQDDFQSYPDANPLRAAMIVFLMMKEAGNV